MSAAAKLRDRRRALDAIARELCESYFTDGFCNGSNPDCKCRRLAAGSLNAMAVVGVEPVWVSSPERRASLPASNVKLDQQCVAVGVKSPADQGAAPADCIIDPATGARQEGRLTVAGSG